VLQVPVQQGSGDVSVIRLGWTKPDFWGSYYNGCKLKTPKPAKVSRFGVCLKAMIVNNSKLIYLHGLEGTSQGVKAVLLRGIFPGILTPDMRGTLEERMESLHAILGEQPGWTIIGSSFGGLMAAIFACQHPRQVDRLVLLAPALIWPDFASAPPEAVDVPTLIFHGSRDVIIPLAMVRPLAERVFRVLDFRVVDDDHGLYKTMHEIDWPALIGISAG
jgi:pimeloyl-ACP methyl ester carboxylesterase